MRKLPVAAVVLSVLSDMSFFAQTSPAPVATRLAAQNALFDEQYESSLKTSPGRAITYGNYR